mmetsp:Transcript_54407/g.129657  ORF Transcript_54407/g.129657 Transcript_54407/m.129657 type:complete len:340 (+) Transcript_54407:95-1114(+)|eukprot:CAMPEP_0178392192 /NCGR_PEP_ID=MMETSP0689_2-20121128/11554_1 /TAXON_ID=160604 /ORGANISM="Amphidinium massartii, Strain CS-259" /LENGTH=339 /DNA_ID=CAMNT_0020012763 /DNA_START=62 /DNA_END=1081 /DNA_ORIENTATION=-
MEEALVRAARTIEKADALLIMTGAGMGVDSGLGTFRGRNAGVWAPLKALRMDFSEMSSPQHFTRDPRLAWAFWHFRHEAYTKGSPHAGYNLLSKWGNAKSLGCFSVTSNIDGHWARTAGIGPEKIYECHGALTHMQCIEGSARIWETDPEQIGKLKVPTWDLQPGEEVEATVGARWVKAIVEEDGASLRDAESGKPIAALGVRRPGGEDLMRVESGCPLPSDPETGAAARPNVLMFGDWGVICDRINKQSETFDAWKSKLSAESKVAIVEVGAGKAVPTIRRISEATLGEFPQSTLVRINLDDSDISPALSKRGISVGGFGALDALSRIDALMQGGAGE